MNQFRRNELPGLLLSAFFLFSVIVITWIALDKIKEETKANSREALQTVLETTHDALNIWLTQRKLHISKLASSPELRELTQALLSDSNKPIHKSNTHLHALRHFMHRRLEDNADKGFFIIDKNMNNIASMRDSNLGQQNLIYQQRPEYMQRLLNGYVSFIPTIKSDVPMQDEHGKQSESLPTIFIGSPIRDNNGEIIAVFTIRMDPFIHFIRIAQIGRIGLTGETYAFDRQARLISESRFDSQLRRTGLINANQKGILMIRLEDPGRNLTRNLVSRLPNHNNGLTYMAKNAITGKSGFSVEGYRDYRGVRVFGAWLWDDSMGFGLTTEIDEDEALQPFYSTRLVIISVLAATVALSFTLSFLLFWVRKQSERSLESAYNELELRVEERTRELKSARDELEASNSRLAVLATIDPLTSLYNRRYFDQHYEQEWSRCKRYHLPFSIIMLDIDFFKSYNDHYGHIEGDKCLQRISSILKDRNIASRPGDIVARYGGEEFIVLLSGTQRDQAIKIADKILIMVQNENIPHTKSQVTDTSIVTVSIGVATEDNCSLSSSHDLIGKADKALYAAKDNGRNQVAEGK